MILKWLDEIVGFKLQPDEGIPLYDEAAQAIFKVTEKSVFISHLTQPHKRPKVSAYIPPENRLSDLLIWYATDFWLPDHSFRVLNSPEISYYES